jgi:hypothetical protein
VTGRLLADFGEVATRGEVGGERVLSTRAFHASRSEKSGGGGRGLIPSSDSSSESGLRMRKHTGDYGHRPELRCTRDLKEGEAR